MGNRLQTVIEVLGPAGAGKSTLALELAKAMRPATGLLLDACADQGLTRHLLGKRAARTLPDVVQELLDASGQFAALSAATTPGPELQQAIDWLFSDLPVALTQPEYEGAELLTTGLLPEQLPASIAPAFRYGLSRLLKTHDYLVIDGYHPLIHALLPENDLTLLLASPPDGADNLLPAGLSVLKTPSLVITQFDGQPLSQRLQTAIAQNDVRLIGKLPVFNSDLPLEAPLSSLFHECLNRLDLPLLYAEGAPRA